MAPSSPVPSRLARERVRLRRSFAVFLERFWPVVTGMPLVRNRAIDALASTLQRVADGELTRVLIALPPGTGKSTVLALYSAWRLARDPAHRSIHASHAHDLAATESRRVRRLVESDEFRSLFPAVELRPDESRVDHWATTRDGRYVAVGTDGALLGRRAREAILDDPMDGIDRWSSSVKERLWEWFNSSLLSRLDGDMASTIVVQQRLCNDDLIGRLIEAGGWHLVELPAELEDGELLAPNVLSREKLNALRVQIGSAIYACMYLQRPSGDDNANIPRSWWRFHRAPHVDERTPRPRGVNIDAPAIETPTLREFGATAIVLDPTFGGTKATNDFACIQAWGRRTAPTGKILFYLLAQWRKRATQLEQRTALRRMMEDYPRAKVYIERTAGGAGFIEELTAAGIPVEPVIPLGSKEQRIGMVSPAIEEGRALLPLGADWLPDFIEELAGATRHDDAQDCVAMGLHVLGTAGEDTLSRWRKMAGGTPDARTRAALWYQSHGKAPGRGLRWGV